MKLPKYLVVLSGLLLAVLVVFVGLKAWNAYAEHSRIGVAVRDRDVMSVDGTGKITTTPDVALVTLGVQTDAATVRAAQQENTKKMNAITAMVKGQGVAEKDLTTAGYSIYPRVDWNSGKQTILGYTVTQSLSVKIRDLDKTGDIISQAGDLGANQVGGINFTIDEPEALRDQARDKAIADAKKKAEALARQLGVTIVKAVSFAEQGVGGPIYPMYSKTMEYDVANGQIAAPAPDIQTGSQDVVSNVTVVFEIY